MMVDFLMVSLVVDDSNKVKGLSKLLLKGLIKKGVNPKSKGNVVKGGTTPPRCPKCERNHVRECSRGTKACFGCGKMQHNISKYPKVANMF